MGGGWPVVGGEGGGLLSALCFSLCVPYSCLIDKCLSSHLVFVPLYGEHILQENNVFSLDLVTQ